MATKSRKRKFKIVKKPPIHDPRQNQCGHKNPRCRKGRCYYGNHFRED